MSSPTSLDDLSNMPETGNTIKTLHELKQESSPDSNNEMNIDGEMSNDNSNHSNSNHKMHTYDGDFVMDNEYNDYEELRKSLVNKRRLSSIKRPHGPFLDHNNQIDKRSLLRLPTEILLQIFHYLERRDWYSLLTTCSEIADLIIEMLWFRPHMQNDSAFKKIKEVMEINKSVTHWDYRQFIKRLNLSFMTKLVDDELLSLFIGCPRLERLTLVNCAKLTRYPITQVLNGCERLQSIDLTGVTDIHDDIINALANNCPRLQGLYAPGCGNVSEEAIIKLLRSCPMLKRVKFNSSTNITDESILVMYENCKSLVEIDLHGCENVTDKYLKSIFLDLTQLREFRISNAPGITDKLFESIPEGHILEKLRIIDITGCNAITDRLVEKLVSCAPRLRNVVLSKCMQITDASLRALSQLGRSLHYIHLGHCGLITDYGVAALVRYCHRIQYIDLACCSQLTDWTLVELANLPKLRRIGLVKCSMITDLGILELVRRRGEQDCLERVHLSYCTNLTIGPIYLLLKNCPKLTHLSLTGISSFLRREITQYCREPPSDFNEHQKSLFCVFSGHGVNQLRNYLNQVVEERTYQIDQGDIHTLFNERRRRFLNGDIDMDEEEMNIWERRRGLGVTADLGHPDMAEINREIFRELNEGNMGPDEMREHFQRLIRNHHQQRLLEHQNRLNQQLVQQRQQQQQQEPQLEQENLQNRGQIETQAPDQLPNEGQLRLQPPLQQQRAQNTIINNPQNAPQIEQPAVFPNGENQTLPLVLNEDEDVDMEPVDLFPRNT
ncbi:F-box and leucine-rich repeat protein GRR1 [Candida albicans L26]|uniref:SCF ubiquitin ligase complex subunit n=2 Tax=Candida albicans TaxID=5476 RepID=A0A1D8PP13_CANAL|nr:SCF ubiquitin ligase complex subunit [Candida albicans SC5314]AOW29866.1 SCF ubiquitin ligase complex subunit [Candida albicans SC5314]KGR07860.1 F-box and leucine-rich repeat protein GRR1 [Candida albicans P78048]KGU06992.1 F-box and leucine-rich repeat protein GRR1 [Candida albicans L26]KHC51289.1 F-box and leucine-rich repeat protein GRR1 [Candida albicans P37039]|eukprot:XP_721853.2 SCF ubiquitin ligase complex subunit [Candida albicans SC5314]